MTKKFLIVLITLFLFQSVSNLLGQNVQWWEREFGVGIIQYKNMPTYNVIDTIYSKPENDSAVKAVLNGRNLILANGESVFPFKRMIEYDYEIPGWAILEFTEDSSWAKISLDPNILSTPPKGWVNLEKENNSFLLWSEYLPTRRSLFFLEPTSLVFYASPNGEIENVSLEKDKSSGRFDYSIEPISRKDNWLQVEIVTPNPNCKTEVVEASRKVVWIKYLKDDLRPNVFYFTRGC